ncbi:glycosyltransferase family protein 64 C3 [Melia azedarach]|uniref:Glycosyltransferase family protein 64 C3 n=1 Tax=Melia azedarach TaxID=155640 RepID=A0ACC1X889_MELAZ|nr:glycosyltransferase family protein 64 C3 [Melia azedarach]
MNLVISLSFLFLGALDTVFSTRTLLPDPCDAINQREPRTLRWDQITVLINGYSEYRIPLLQSIAATYSASPLVSSVIVLWGNPSTPTETLSELSRNLSLSSFGAASISLVRQSSSSLNARFLPRLSIGTHAVLICDDDVEMDQKSFEFAFRVWQSNSERLIGTFARSHDIDLLNKEWIYTVHADKYSIVLTKFMILKSSYLFKYSCGGGAAMIEMRKIVDEMHNCEDILMNFVVADEANAGPTMVGAERIRDWGDARNDDNHEGDGDGGRGLRSRISAVGLSSRKMEHRKRRGKCIMEFHRVLGRMPLRYSYGKVVNSVGEQGLCEKEGKLVFCDQF